MGVHEHSGADWEEMAKIYKQLTVTVSSKPIMTILEHLNARWPFSRATGIHDNGTGPGPIISRLFKEYGLQIPASCVISASDFSSAMIEQVNKTKKEEVAVDPESLWAKVETSVKDAMNLEGIPDESRSHMTAGWVYFMTPDPMKCLTESKRVLGKDGVLGCSSWKGSQWMDIMKSVEEVRPDQNLFEIPEAWMNAEGMKEEFEKAGFRDVESMEVAVEMTIEEYQPFLDLMTDKMPHIVNAMKDFSDEERQRTRDMMLEKTKKLAPTLPGTLHGTALVAIGRK